MGFLLLGLLVVGGISFDHRDTFEGVEVHSTEVDGARVFYMTRTHTFPLDMATVYDYLLGFDRRCNNEHRERRKFIPRDFNCPYRSASIVENVIERSLKKDAPAEEGVDLRFILKRRIYNRGSFSYNDLVTVRTRGAEKRIDYRMLTGEEAKTYIDSPLEFNSAFHGTRGSYSLKARGERGTEVVYTYFTRTNHWLLKHSWVRSRVAKGIFWGIKNSIDQLTLLEGNRKASP